MNWIKDNGGVLVIGVLLFGGVLGYMELRAPGIVQSQLEANGIVPKTTIDGMKEDITDLEAEDEKLDGKIERIVGILLED